MINLFRSATSCGVLGLRIVVGMVLGYSQSAEASLINVSKTVGGSASYSVKLVSNAPYDTVGPVTFSTTNASATVGTLAGNYYAAASNSGFSQSSAQVGATLGAQVNFSTGASFYDFNGTASSSMVVSFEVDQSEFYVINRNFPNPGSSYVLNHTNAAIKLESMIGGNPVTLQSLGYGSGSGSQVLLSAGIPYRFTVSASGNIPQYELGAKGVAVGGFGSLSLVPEPTTLCLIFPAAMCLVRRRSASQIT